MLRRPFTLALLAVACVIPASAQAFWGTTGSGAKVTQAREVAAFEVVRLKGSLDVRIKVGPERSLSVTIDDNLQELVKTTVDGGALVIETKSMSYNGVGRVDLTVPTLREVTLSGSGDISIDGGSGELHLGLSGSGDIDWRGTASTLDVKMSGSGDVQLDGTAESATLALSGSGDVDADGLTAKSADVSISGSGDVDVTLGGGSFRARVSGSGDVTWRGTATVSEVRVSGSGSVEQH